MTISLDKLVLVGSVLAALLSACSSGGGGGGGGISAVVIHENEPNDTFGTARTLVLGETGHGAALDDTDTDWWRVHLDAGQIVSIEAFGSRFDQAGWTTGPNSTQVTLVDTDGATVLFEQSAGIFNWISVQDTDLLAVRAPATGTYYLKVAVDDAGLAGGEYLISTRETSLASPLQLEQELAGMTGGNDTDATAEPVAPGLVYGFHVDDESDWYTFTVADPSLLTFAVIAHRNGALPGDTSFDPEINLYDSALTNLSNNDDVFYLDSSIQWLVSTPGTYFLEVTECCVTGDAPYFLEFDATDVADLSPVAEVEPNDTPGAAQSVPFGNLVQGSAAPGNDDFYSIACNAGDRILVQIFDQSMNEDATAVVTVVVEDALGVAVPANTGSELRILRTILTSPGAYSMHVSTVNATSYALRVTRAGAGPESEPNDSVADAGAFDANGLGFGVIALAGDADLFAFDATAGVPILFDCLANASNSPGGFDETDDFGSTMDPLLNVEDATGTVLATSDSLPGDAVGVIDGQPSVSLVFLPPTTGTFYLEVLETDGDSGPDAYYVIQKR